MAFSVINVFLTGNSVDHNDPDEEAVVKQLVEVNGKVERYEVVSTFFPGHAKAEIKELGRDKHIHCHITFYRNIIW